MEVPFQTYFVNGMQQMDLTGVYYTEVKETMMEVFTRVSWQAETGTMDRRSVMYFPMQVMVVH